MLCNLHEICKTSARTKITQGLLNFINLSAVLCFSTTSKIHFKNDFFLMKINENEKIFDFYNESQWVKKMERWQAQLTTVSKLSCHLLISLEFETNSFSYSHFLLYAFA
jgi:hypothetical protein